MAQSLSSPHPISQHRRAEVAGPSVLLLAGIGLAGLVVIATGALWFHYGTQVFFEMIRTGFSACF